jgi:hypothetical protein
LATYMLSLVVCSLLKVGLCEKPVPSVGLQENGIEHFCVPAKRGGSLSSGSRSTPSSYGTREDSAARSSEEKENRQSGPGPSTSNLPRDAPAHLAEQPGSIFDAFSQLTKDRRKLCEEIVSFES